MSSGSHGTRGSRTACNRPWTWPKPARGRAASRRACSPSSGARVALMLPTCAGFLHAFAGILYAGCIPVPIYPPARLSQLEDHLRRQAAILANAEAELLITVREGRPLAHFLRSTVQSMRSIETVDSLVCCPACNCDPPVSSHFNSLLRRSARNRRAEQQRTNRRRRTWRRPRASRGAAWRGRGRGSL